MIIFIYVNYLDVKQSIMSVVEKNFKFKIQKIYICEIFNNFLLKFKI